MILVVGSTGLLGSAISLKLAREGKVVAGLVRDVSSAKARTLRDGGVTLVSGNLTQPHTLEAALAQVEAIICTATAILSSGPSNTLDDVDNRGIQSLITAAEKRGVRQFVFVSYDTAGGTYPLAAAKRAAEQRLQASKLNWTILQPAAFCEVWFSPVVGFDVAASRARIYGDGDRPLHYIALDDVAKAAVACVNNAAASRKIFRFGGGTPASQLEAVNLWERATGRRITCERTSLAELQATQAVTTDPVMLSVLGLCELAAKGIEVDHGWKTALGLEPLRVEDWIAATLKKVRPST
jgi:uncharacterized protein YbjT (DUF2867 family)